MSTLFVDRSGRKPMGFEFVADTQSYVMMGPSAERIKEDLIQAFNRDVEGKIRQALIDLGWTPPAEGKG